jgi:hyperosmotically inducible periplasmic protein
MRCCRIALDMSNQCSDSSPIYLKEIIMKKIIVLIATAAFSSVALFGAGCAVLRDQETVGAYVDDTTITTRVKARFVEDATVDASAISVETLKGTVQLSGFAKSAAEKSKAESIARGVKGVVAVQNAISVRS